jgi:hypothetical protein
MVDEVAGTIRIPGGGGEGIAEGLAVAEEDVDIDDVEGETVLIQFKQRHGTIGRSLLACSVRVG